MHPELALSVDFSCRSRGRVRLFLREASGAIVGWLYQRPLRELLAPHPYTSDTPLRSFRPAADDTKLGVSALSCGGDDQRCKKCGASNKSHQFRWIGTKICDC